jgi:hypothetical protein
MHSLLPEPEHGLLDILRITIGGFIAASDIAAVDRQRLQTRMLIRMRYPMAYQLAEMEI